jgi:hypothetical protein
MYYSAAGCAGTLILTIPEPEKVKGSSRRDGEESCFAPSTLLLLEREEDPRDIRKRIDSLLTKCNPQQLEMVHRIIKVLLEP